MKEFSSRGGGPADTHGRLACRVGREGEGAGRTEPRGRCRRGRREQVRTSRRLRQGLAGLEIKAFQNGRQRAFT